MKAARARALVVVLALLVPVAGAPAAGAHDPDDAKAEAFAGRAGSAGATAALAAVSGVPCVDGSAAGYPCENVDLEAFVPLSELGEGPGLEGLDIWGWTDPETGREYALQTTTRATVFVDISDPQNPVILGALPTQSSEGLPFWRDVKVYGNHAYVVSENFNHGMQVFDLTRLRTTSPTPEVFAPDAVYRGFGRSHNLVINEDSGFAYAVGSDTCAGGLHMIDLHDPADPTFAGCYADDGYIHDAQCVIFHGSNRRLQGRELCFALNRDAVTIVDVTDKGHPRRLSRTVYPNAFSAHQGWLTPDHRWFLFGDEADELIGSVPGTTTYVMQVANPLNPSRPQAFSAETAAIDHNRYIHDGLLYEANYHAGLRIYDYDERSLRRAQLREVGYFDIFPADDDPGFQGAWSSYPYFASGVVIVSGIDSGLFVLRPRL
jgi:choice-of-anchor B domain-containing protein